MTANPSTVTPDTSVADAYLLMTEGAFRHLVVVADGRPIGMVSDRDILRHMPPPSRSTQLEQGRFASEPVKSIMSSPVLSLSANEPIETAADIMLTEHVSALAVTDDEGRLRGVITLADLTRFAGWLIRSLPLPWPRRSSARSARRGAHLRTNAGRSTSRVGDRSRPASARRS